MSARLRAIRALVLAASVGTTSATLLAGCVDLGGAEQSLCTSRPGLCPSSPAAPTNLTIAGWAEECRTLQVDVGSWTPHEPQAVVFRWSSCDGNLPTSACSPLPSDFSEPYLTVSAREVGRYIKAEVMTSDDGVDHVFTAFTGPVQEAAVSGRDTAFFTGFETLSTLGSNVSGDGVLAFTGTADAHYGAAVMEIPGSFGSRATIPIPGGPQRSPVRFAFRFVDALPAVGVLAKVPLHRLGVEEGAVTVLSAGTQLRLMVEVAGGSVGMPAELQLVAGAWFEVELGIDASTTTVRVSWQVSGTQQPPVDVNTGQPYDLPLLQLGPGVQVNDYLAQFDDVVIGLPGDGFPMGDLRVEPLKVVGSGLHQSPGSMLWTTDNGNTLFGLASGDTVSWDALDDWPVESLGSADGVYQSEVNSIAYAEYPLGDLSGWSRAVSVRPIFVVHGIDGPVASISGVLADDRSAPLVFSHDASSPLIDQSPAFRDRTFSRGLDESSGWTTCGVNALRARFGYSVDVSNRPMLDAVMAEVLVIPL